MNIKLISPPGQPLLNKIYSVHVWWDIQWIQYDKELRFVFKISNLSNSSPSYKSRSEGVYIDTRCQCQQDFENIYLRTLNKNWELELDCKAVRSSINQSTPSLPTHLSAHSLSLWEDKCTQTWPVRVWLILDHIQAKSESGGGFLMADTQQERKICILRRKKW